MTGRSHTRRTVLRGVLALALPGWARARPAQGEEAIQASLQALDAQPLWISDRGVTAAGRAMLAQLQAAETRGLRSRDYAGPWQAAAVESAPGPAALQAFDHALSRNAARFVLHLQRGRVRAQDAGYALPLPREPLDLAAALRGLATSADVERALDALEPRYRHYLLLKQALARYRRLAQGHEVALPALPSRSVRSGESYEGAGALRERLALLGDLPPGEAPAGAQTQLDSQISAGLAHFQARHGLAIDGTLGHGTWVALNVPLAARVEQIELAMERVRWLPPPGEGPFIIVNVPQFRLFAFRGPEDSERAMIAMNVIVGRTFPQTHTPVFMADLRFVVFRPYWDVPTSIARKEVLPMLRRDAAKGQREGYELVRGPADTSPVVATTPETLEQLAQGSLRVRQRPGKDNALGPIKFLMPNSYNVYLHGTPAQNLFSRTLRAFSHGCIRVEDPVQLAQFVFAEDPSWTRERIEAGMNGEQVSQRITLHRPIRVVVFYATALAAEDGRTLFFDDIYQHDRRLAALLAQQGPS